MFVKEEEKQKKQKQKTRKQLPNPQHKICVSPTSNLNYAISTTYNTNIGNKLRIKI